MLQLAGSHKQVPLETSTYPGRQLVHGPLRVPVAQPIGSWTQFITSLNVQPGRQLVHELFP